MNTRLQQFLAAENISQAQLADSLNVARAGVSHILAGRNKPSYDFLTALMSRYPKLNLEWLMFGKGKMYKEAEESAPPVPQPEQPHENDLLFSDEEMADDYDAMDEISRNFRILNEIKASANTSQVAAKQRNVKKIIILFDDGSFQEM